MDAILSAVFGFCFCCCFCCLWCQRLKGHRVGDSGCPKCPLPCKGFWAASKLSVCALTRKPAADTSLSFVLVSSLKRVVVYVIVNSVSLGTGFQFPLWKGVCRVMCMFVYVWCSNLHATTQIWQRTTCSSSIPLYWLVSAWAGSAGHG